MAVLKVMPRTWAPWQRCST